MYEEINPAEEESTSAFDVEISDRVIYYLQQTCRWAMLLVYFTGGALLLFVLIVAVKWVDVEEAFYRAYGTYESVFVAVLVCLVLVYGLLLGLLYNFTLKVKRGILAQDVVAIQQGIATLKFYFILSAIFGGAYLAMAIVTTIKLFT